MSDNPLASGAPGASPSPAQQAPAVDSRRTADAVGTTAGLGDGTTFPIAATPTAAEAGSGNERGVVEEDDRPRVSGRYITFLLLALFGANLAFVTPIAISLAIQVQKLAPENVEYLGLVLGLAAGSGVLLAPLFGVLSDRTRSRLGRRRPWMIIGLVVGLLGLTVLALAPNIVVLAIGWIISTLGWGQVIGGLQNSQADRLPASQRGKVAGLTGVIGQVAPVVGAVAGGGLASNSFLLFLVPGVVGVVLVLLFVLFVNEADTRGMVHEDKLDVRGMLGKYVFQPKRYPDFSWNFVGRFFFFFGLTLNSTFTAFFIGSKLGLPVDQIGGTIAILGLLGIVGTMGGAIGGGFLSDKLRRRRLFVMGGGVIFSVGAVIVAFAPSLEVIIIGSVLSNLGIGVFSAVDQALVLDVLPERNTQAARFNALNSFSFTLPQALAPLVAPAFLLIGAAADGDKNYTPLYLASAVFTIIGGLVVLAKVKAVR